MEDLKEESKLQLNHIGMKASTVTHWLLQEKQHKLLLVVVISQLLLSFLFTGAQPKAGTGHKMQTFFFSTLHC